jgi:hypothetical protein
VAADSNPVNRKPLPISPKEDSPDPLLSLGHHAGPIPATLEGLDLSTPMKSSTNETARDYAFAIVAPKVVPETPRTASSNTAPLTLIRDEIASKPQIPLSLQPRYQASHYTAGLESNFSSPGLSKFSMSPPWTSSFSLPYDQSSAWSQSTSTLVFPSHNASGQPEPLRSSKETYIPDTQASHELDSHVPAQFQLPMTVGYEPRGSYHHRPSSSQSSSSACPVPLVPPKDQFTQPVELPTRKFPSIQMDNRHESFSEVAATSHPDPCRSMSNNEYAELDSMEKVSPIAELTASSTQSEQSTGSKAWEDHLKRRRKLELIQECL